MRHTREIVSMDGVPRRSVIRSNWWTTFFPGNKGFPVNTSAKMQPMLQTSMAVVYCNVNNLFESNQQYWKKMIMYISMHRSITVLSQSVWQLFSSSQWTIIKIGLYLFQVNLQSKFNIAMHHKDYLWVEGSTELWSSVPSRCNIILQANEQRSIIGTNSSSIQYTQKKR